MHGMNAATGKELSGIDHLRQSVHDILTTPITTRSMRRDYGSRLFDLVDAPTNPGTMADIYAATVEAISTHEPRYKVKRVTVAKISSDGVVDLQISGEYRGELTELFYSLDFNQ